MRQPPWLWEGVALALAAAWLCTSKPTDQRSILLPPSLLPEHYEISLAPRLDKGVFHGVVVITGVAVAHTDRIVLHCKGLLFNSTLLVDLTTDEELGVEDIQEDLLLQQCHLFLNHSLQLDHEYRLTMEFMGYIGKDGVGLYKDFYHEEGVRHDILVTLFQPNHARSMFPCWDEPHYKAQFLLRVSASHQFPTVISNMPVISVSPPDPEAAGHRWVELEETPPMSPYLLVLVLCDYLALTDSVTNSSVWAPRSRLHEAQLALNVSVAVLDYAERYFDTEYTLPKLDHVPVPSLNTVAMENWGAITYKKDFLLWEEGVSTYAQREMISQVICHEVVHQWLGNLVTMAWWNTTWLNEGLATFYHYYIIDKIEPSFNVMDNMFVIQIMTIFNEEATRDPKPLTNNEPFPQDAISQAFSASTYLKGAAIIRMVFNLMAPDIFREAMVQYIADNEYGSVDEEDLWESLAAAADLPVDLESVMYSWTHQPGFPLVTVTRAADGCISLRQEKYLSKDESDVRWTIPVTYTTSSELDFNFSSTVWFAEDQTELETDIRLEPADWVIFNIRQSGFYRVKYDPLTWKALTHDLQNCDVSDIHPVNRGQLLHDGFDLARHGLLEYPVILELARYLSRETEYLPWAVAIHWLSSLRAHLYNSDYFLLFERYAVSLVDDVFQKLPLRGDAGGILQELQRKQIVEFACRVRHRQCVKEATDAVYLLMSGVQVRIPQDLKPVLLCAAVRHGQPEVWHFVLKEYLAASENDRWKYLTALACSSDRDTLERLLKEVASPKSFIKSTDDRHNLLVEVGKQDNTLELILDMIIGRFTFLEENFDLEVILHILRSSLTPKLSTDEKKKIVEIGALVDKKKQTKQMELISSMTEEFDKEDFLSLHDGSVRSWFVQQGQDDEVREPTTVLVPPKDDRPTPTPEPDSRSSTAKSVSTEESSEDYKSEEIKEDPTNDPEDVAETVETSPAEDEGSCLTTSANTSFLLALTVLLHVLV